MTTQEPDYSSYDLEALEDIAFRIDRAKYPDRWARIQDEIRKRHDDPARAAAVAAFEKARSRSTDSLMSLYAANLGLFALLGCLVARIGSARSILVISILIVSITASILLATGHKQGRLVAGLLFAALVPHFKIGGMSWMIPIGPAFVVGVINPQPQEIIPIIGLAFGTGFPGAYIPDPRVDHFVVNLIPLVAAIQAFVSMRAATKS